MSTTVTYQGDTIATLENETKTLLTQGKWAENNIIITDSTRGGVETETDPVFSASPAASITQTNINNWNNKSDFSGNYNDLTNKPTIPAAQVSSDWNATSGIAQILHKPTLSNVATSGNYEDLTNKPVLDTSLSTVSTRAVENQAISIALEDKASKQYVDTAISNIPSPMIFKGSLGTNGTITSLPNASAINTGFTYKVIQAGIYASQTAEIGDIFISDGSTWILIPSGDDIANVVVTPVQSSGTKIAVVTVNDTSTDLYAPTPVAPPNASTLAPNMDGTAAAGTSTSYARADHIHPVDTSRASANDVSSLTTRVGSLETAIGTGGSVDNKIATAIQGLDSSITATSGEAISAITITDGKITTSSKISIPSYSVATTAANGLMSSSDKIKLNNLSTVDNNTTYANATTATDGLMSSTDKLKLDNCSTGSATALQYVKDGPYQSVLLGSVTSNKATGLHSVAENNGTTASGLYSHAEGSLNLAQGTSAHAEGQQTTASGERAHTEGVGTKAVGNDSHAEGQATTAQGGGSHSEGSLTKAGGAYSHAEGSNTIAMAPESHAEGHSNIVIGAASYAHAEGNNTTANGIASHVEGYYTYSNSTAAHAEGYYSRASGPYSHAEGGATTASGRSSHAEGSGSNATTIATHAEGYNTTASKRYSHAEGHQTHANGEASHAEGYGTKTTNDWSHAEGNQSTASGNSAHAEGGLTLSSGQYSHSEGETTQATDQAAHAEGINTIASGLGAHAGGNATTASGYYSHTNGDHTVAAYYSQTVIGSYNTTTGSLPPETAFVIGNGTSAARSNAFAVKWDGTLVFANGTEITPAQFAQLLTLLN